MKNVKLNTTKNLKGLAVAGIFMIALLMPAFLCGCSGKSSSEELLFQMSDEADTQGSPLLDVDEGTLCDTFESEEIAWIYVYVCGAVENPDVYQVDAKSRLFEVIEMAGGFTPDADRASLNLARNVADGEQIVVYTVEETANGMIPVSGNTAVQQDGGLVNINKASLAELTGISGIGESRAQAIIDYREKNGGFRSVEEIKNVDGIKDGLFSKIKDYITI